MLPVDPGCTATWATPRVVVDDERGEHDTEFGDDVDPATWQQIDLRAPKHDGTWAEVSLLRPTKWLEEQLALSHQSLEISVPECGIDGRAEIRRIRPCPVIRPGPGKIVTGTFAHQSAQVVDLYVEGLEEPLGTTGNHPFWNDDRKEYVRADRLQVGERLRTLTGKTPKVLAVVSQDEPAAVYNLEIQFAHVYHVGNDVILVHNGKGKKKNGSDAAQCNSATVAKGGTYKLIDSDTNQVVRTGRTKDLNRRETEHARDPLLKDYDFEVDRRTDIFAQQRGREQVVHDLHKPPLNKVRPIRANHPKLQDYLDAAELIRNQ